MDKAENTQVLNGESTQSQQYVRKGGDSTISSDDFATFEELSETKFSNKTKGGKNANDIQNEEKSAPKEAKEKIAEAKKVQKELEKEMGLDGKKSKAQSTDKESEDEDTEADKELEAQEKNKKKLDADESEDESEEKEEKVSEKQDVPKIKFRQGDADVEIDPAATVQVKVNGKLEDVAVKDLMSEYSGRVDLKRKYSALDVERKQFQNEVKELDTRVNKLHELAVKEKNPRMAIGYLAEMLGADPREVWKQLKTEIGEQLIAASKLSPEQQEALEAREEVEYYRRKAEDAQKSAKESQELETLKNRVTQTQEKFGMTPAQFKQNYDALVKEAATSGYSENDLTPEMVGEYFQLMQRNGKLKTMLDETFSGYENKVGLFAELKDVWAQNPSFSLDDIKDIAMQVYGAKKKSGLAKRIEAEKKTNAQSNRISTDNFDTWADLERQFS